MSKANVYEIITNQIIALLDRGEIPWRKPWVNSTHYNIRSKKPYNGINPLVLDTVASLEGYSSPLWATMKQANEKKGKVRKGEHPTYVVWWHVIKEKDDEGRDTNVVAFMKPIYSKVWNAEQIDWEDPSVLEGIVPEVREETEIDINKVLFESMGDLELTHGGNVACYFPRSDRVNMPKPEQFVDDNEYYSTLYHELTHATGHKSRLGRFNGNLDETQFGSQSYSKEELIAEFGAAFLCARTNIDDVRVLENSAAYIQGWKKRLTENPKWWSNAASAARKSTEFILDGKTSDKAGEEE